MATYSPDQINQFIAQLFGHQHDNVAFASALTDMETAKVPSINISSSQGMLLHVLTKALNARKILEIGTLGGYSALWMASALPSDGKLITLEINETHAAVARQNIERAKLSEVTEVRLGPAIDTLQKMVDSGEGEFDITFIDADKDSYPQYLEFALRLTRIGGIILADNTLKHGAMDPDAETGITKFNTAVAGDKRLSSAIIPVMKDGIDGLTISYVLSK